jgi:predicted dehydrogenase
MIRNVVSLDCKIRIAITGCKRISKQNFEPNINHANQLELVSACNSGKAPWNIWN